MTWLDLTRTQPAVPVQVPRFKDTGGSRDKVPVRCPYPGARGPARNSLIDTMVLTAFYDCTDYERVQLTRVGGLS